MSLTERQKEIRRTGIGASEIAVIAGISKYSSPIAIWEAKVRGLDLESTYQMELGNELEAPIARAWAKINNRFIAPVDTLRHETHKYAVATPDRAVYVSARSRGDGRKLKTDVRDAEKILQVKSTNWRQRHLWGPEKTDSIPDDFLCQAHWEGSVSGQAVVEFAVDFDKTNLCTWIVRTDRTIFEALYSMAEKFMVDHVEKQVPPLPDASDQYTEYLKRVFPRDNENMIRIEEVELIEDIFNFAKCKELERRIEAEKKLFYQKIISRIGENSGIEGDFGKITFKKTKDSVKVNHEAIARDALVLLRLMANDLPEGDHRQKTVQAINECETRNTETKIGHRTLRTIFTDAFDFKQKPLNQEFKPLPERGIES